MNISADTMRAVVQKAFQQWLTADCGNGTTPNFIVDVFPDVKCTNIAEMTGDAGYKSSGPNYNIWMFRDDEWPYASVAGAESAIAVTTVQFNPTTGEIFDADVELDSENKDWTFTTELGQGGMDLPSVVQHESGHFLGLAHAQPTEPTATMNAYIDPTETNKRTLEADDIAAICAAYPPGQLNPNCDPEPRHGFSTECEFDKGCCTVAPGRSAGHRGFGVALLGIVLSAAARRRSKSKAGKGASLLVIGDPGPRPRELDPIRE